MKLPVWSILLSGASTILVTLTLLLYILGAARHVTDFEENTCQMTYMFEYPQYVRITLENEVETRHPRYALYAYGEGYITERIRRMQFSGIPVLFLPGNAGSHQQVRSLASVSLRKSLKDRTRFHFDFFTVSFGMDYSGLYGGVLMDETHYVAHCVRKILSLYKTNVSKVILIGHSMGGVVAKGSLLLTPNLNATSVSLILSLATPYTPNLVPDNTMAAYYLALDQKAFDLNDAGTVLVSIGGGPRDLLVTSAQSIDPNADISVLSTGVPEVWRSMDHLSILWCKQLILAVVRALFDSVDPAITPPNLFLDRKATVRAMDYHLRQRTAGKRLHQHQDKFQFERGALWIEDIRRRYTWSNDPNRRTSSVYLMVRLGGQLDHLTVEAINLEAKDWLFVCGASSVEGHSRVCDWGWNLTNHTRVSPDPLHRLRKSADLDLRQLSQPGVTHIVIRVPYEDQDNLVTISVDIYALAARMYQAHVGSREFTPEPGALRLYIDLPGVQDLASVELEFSQCEEKGHYAGVELLEPKVGPTLVQFYNTLDNGPKRLKLQTRLSESNAALRFTLDPACAFRIKLSQGSLIDRLSVAIRDRWPVLHTTLVALLILILSIRVDHTRTPVVVVTGILSIFYGLALESCVAVGTLAICALGVCCGVIFLGSLAHNIAVRFLARCITFSTTWSDWLLGGLHQLPFITALILLSLVPATCGALAMLLSIFLQFLGLVNMYEDYLEELLLASLQHFGWTFRLRGHAEESNADTRKKILDNLILFLLLATASLNAVPSVLVWARNFSHEMHLSTEDPQLLGCWLILVACGSSGLLKLPSKDHEVRSQILASLLRLLGWVVLLMGAATSPAMYQRMMPPLAACASLLVILSRVVPC